MIHDKHIIGIDLVRTDSEGGWYGIYESYNHGERWNMVTQSRTIESLINFAKNNSPVSLINRLAALDTKGKR